MYPKMHLHPKLKNASSGHGSIPFKHQQQSKHGVAVAVRNHFMIILILFTTSIFLLLLSRYSSTFAFFFPPNLCLNSLKHSSVILEKATILNGTSIHDREEENHNTLGFCRSLIDGTTNVSFLESKEEYGSDVDILCCDRTHARTDICYMKGDVRTAGGGDGDNSLSIFLSNISSQDRLRKEKIKPYTRKWEESVMSIIDELTLIPVSKHDTTFGKKRMECDVTHKVPGVVFSAGGYTGNVYHDFNDGLIPLFLTTERFKGEVVLLILDYHSWWMSKYKSVIKKISNYKIIKLGVDRRVHCFPEMIVGMKIHGELSIDPQLMPNGMQKFKALLDESFGTPSRKTELVLPSQPLPRHKKPILTMIVRKETRVLLNLDEVIRLCNTIGFQVKIIVPVPELPLSEIYSILSISDVMVTVNGAAMAHFFFTRPGTVLIQIVPLGLKEAGDAFCGQPAMKYGLEYVEYRITPKESSLSKEYGPNSTIISNPRKINRKGWQYTKRIYLGHQNITIDVKRFSHVLTRVYETLIS